MHMIVGLGNPGRQYEESKHNTGFRVVDELAKRWNVTLWQDKMDALVAQTTVNGEKIILVKPQTYMNESGRAVGPLMRWYKIDQPDVYVAYDDMDLAVGRLRIRKNGSDGGHNGIKSLFANGCTDFTRFPEELREAYQQGIEDAATAIEGCLSLGVDKGMNRYNPKKKK